MKKATILAMGAIIAVSAQAQYNVNPSTSVVTAKSPKTVDYIILSEAAIADLQKTGAKVNYIGPSPDEGRNLWYWDNTFIPADDSYPRVDMEEGTYTSVEVGTVGWSGAGFAIDAPGVNISHFNDNTMFHLAYFTPTGNAPASIGAIILDGGSYGSQPAKVALGDPFNDNGAIYPSIGSKATDDWQGVEISLGDLKKIYPAFNLANTTAWQGNVFAWLGGGVTGQTMAFDTMYFYTTEGGSGVEGVEADNAQFVVTRNTINVAGAKGIELYNMAGQTVKKSNGSVLGINDLAAGVYVAKAGKSVRKVVVR